MKRRNKILLIVLGVILVGGLIAANLKFDSKKRITVQTHTIAHKDLRSIVSASGKIDAKRRVNVSANTLGKIVRLAVEEGDRVEKGDFLLQIDPAPYRASVASLEASIRAAQARLNRDQANNDKAALDLKRSEDLRRKNLIPQENLDAARTSLAVAIAVENAAHNEVERQQANLVNARHDLEQVTIHAELSGIVTRLNVEEGENVVTGTMNNPGTVLMTIADLSEIEAEIDVDETDVIDVRPGQETEVSIDAYPDKIFKGKVTQVGNSAISISSGGGPQAVNFRVKVALTDLVPNVRPGLSCTADITVAVRDQSLAVPIQALTIRKPPEPEPTQAPEPGGIEAAQKDQEDGEPVEETEGVFVVREGVARFLPVKIGISGEKDFEVLEGLKEKDVVVTGPYQAIRELQDGDPVKVKPENKKDKS